MWIFTNNLGVVYSKMGDIGPGRYHFELAMKKGYLGSDVLNNVGALKSQIQVADISNSPEFMDQVINALSSIPVGYSFSISLVLVLTLLLLLRLDYIKELKIVVIGALCSFVFPSFHYAMIANKTFAVNLVDMQVYEGPSAIYDVKQTIPAGTKFITGKTNKGWFYIDYPVELTGWVKKEDIGLL